MYCPNCGESNDDSAKFCNSCGKGIVEVTVSELKESSVQSTEQPKAVIEKDDVTDVQNEGEYEFSKRKMIGYLTYKSLHTNAIVTCDKVSLNKQTKVLGFIPLKTKVSSLLKTDIQSAEIVKKMDVIDGIYGIIFGIIGLITIAGGIGLPFLLVSAVCFWTGYGKVINISFNNAAKPMIIASDSGQDEELFIAALMNNIPAKE